MSFSTTQLLGKFSMNSKIFVSLQVHDLAFCITAVCFVSISSIIKFIHCFSIWHPTAALLMMLPGFVKPATAINLFFSSLPNNKINPKNNSQRNLLEDTNPFGTLVFYTTCCHFIHSALESITSPLWFSMCIKTLLLLSSSLPKTTLLNDPFNELS